MEKDVYLVRQGLHEGLGLTTKETEQAAQAGQELLEKLGSHVLILSSSHIPAMKTAKIIAAGFPVQLPIIPSVRIALGGITPQGIKNLDEFIAKAVDESETSITKSNLIIVTHARLIATAKEISTLGSSVDIALGEIHKYTSGTWKNHVYDEDAATLLELEIELAKCFSKIDSDQKRPK